MWQFTNRKLGNVFYHGLMSAYTCSVQQVEVEGRRVAATSSDLPIDHQRCRHGPLSHTEEDLETHVQNNTVLNQDFSSDWRQWHIKTSDGCIDVLR